MDVDEFNRLYPKLTDVLLTEGVDWEKFLNLDAIPDSELEFSWSDGIDSLVEKKEAAMDQQPPTSAGTPNLAQMHMQQQQRPDMLGSPALGSQPMTPQQQQMMQAHTPQYPHDFQQQQQFQQGVPPSPSTSGVPPQHMQGAPMDGSPGMYNRQMMPQAMIQQQQMQQQQMQQQQMQQQQMMGQQGGPMGGMPPQYPGYPSAAQQQQWVQQQQMQQQAHFTRQPQMMGSQPGQQVMIRRVGVPYPQGTAYPQGMQPQAAPVQAPPGAQFPPRPVQGAPQQMQRPPMQYPPGSTAGPPQYPAYPQGQPGYPQGYQQQMYPPRPPQMAQQVRPYISPQSQMVPPQAVYGNNPAQQPQTPQTPQPPFTPNGTRFPQPTPSPHYGAQDLRSPPLMSPNQQQIQAAAGQRPMSNGEMVNPPMRMPCPPAPNHVQSTFFSHDPQIIGNINADNCLIGCNIHVFDAERFNTDKTDYANLALAVKMRGGEVDFGSKTFSDRMPTITHVVVDCIRNTAAQQAIKERKRVVTLQWLADVLSSGKMEVPSKLAHLPSIVGMNNEPRPMSGKLFSLSSFNESERSAIKWMVECVGGRVTPNLSRQNDYLIAKHLGTEKVEKAREWGGMSVVNYQWLADVYLNARPMDGDGSRYLPGSQSSEVNTTPFILEMMHENTKHMMNAWKLPVMVPMTETHNSWQRAIDTRNHICHDDAVFPSKKYRAVQDPAPSEEEVIKAEEVRKVKNIEPQVVVAFTGIDDEVKSDLSRKLRFLGGRVVDNVSECTHLVAVQGSRSVQLLEAIALGKNIVQPYWVIHGYECRQFMDTFDYFLRDEESEKNLAYSCKRSVLRARNRPVFEDVTFYITPSVEPSRHTLTRLIRLAGGKVDEQRPAPSMLADYIETDALYIVISCDSDVKSVSYLMECFYPVYSVEFVLMSLLRQEIQPNSVYRLFYPRPVAPRPPAVRPPPVHQEPPRVRV